MKLTHIPFQHVDGFNDLSKEKKDEFIALYKEYLKYKRPHTSRTLSEEEMTSVYITSQYNYRVTFLNRADIVLKREKERKIVKPKEKEKTSTLTIQVRITIDTHEKIKDQAYKEGITIRELIDKACAGYLNQNNETR